MSHLAPDLFERRYRDLVDLGRSRLPSVAPAWTDHNAHDPGITLIELLAWVGEAQLYSLSRMRRDERAAYAALMGVAQHGARPARGLLWPDHDDAAGPAATVTRGRIIARNTKIHLARAETPVFVAAHRQLWVAARVEALTSRLADGTILDHGAANRRGGPAFQPFGEGDGRGAVLRIKLAAADYAPLFEADRPDDARLVIGVRTDTPRGNAQGPLAAGSATPLAVMLVAEGERFPLPIVEDGSQGLLATGALVLDLAAIETAARSATIEIIAPEGFQRTPRILRIEPNVLPIVQRSEVSESHRSDGKPDQSFDLETPGLEFEPGSDPVRIEVELDGAIEPWTRTDHLVDCGPADRCFVLDPVSATIGFGNGINGAIPPASAAIFAHYSTCEGKVGNIAANRKWVVPGFTGMFGVNPDPTSGGEDPSDWLTQRSEARRSVRQGQALVSATDFEAAALDLAGLEVARAWMMPSTAATAATGTMQLIVMRSRPAGGETAAPLETAGWIEAVRQRLAPRTPMGTRLRVVAPTYRDFTVRLRVEAEPKKDPAEVRQSILDELACRLALVSSKPGAPLRPFGLPVTRRDIAAWLQALSDVRRVLSLAIVSPGQGEIEEVAPVRSGLPRIDLAGSEILVERPGGGGAA